MTRAACFALGALCLSIGLPESSRGQDVTGFESGNVLFAQCAASDSASALSCRAYVAGVADYVKLLDWAELKAGRQKHASWCEPYGVTLGQTVDIVTLYLRNHPEERGQPAASNVYMAMLGAFPCPAQG